MKTDNKKMTKTYLKIDYKKPELDVIKFHYADVIATSPVCTLVCPYIEKFFDGYCRLDSCPQNANLAG